MSRRDLEVHGHRVPFTSTSEPMSRLLEAAREFQCRTNRVRVKRLPAVSVSVLGFILAMNFQLSLLGQDVHPNIVYVLCDDLGYGDVRCLNPEFGKIATPALDRLASEGMTFTDAHSGSAVCTPTRYGIMTGRYAWRTRLQEGVLRGFGPSLIAEGRPTVASFLQSRGYDTAVIGKWHLNQQYLDSQTGERIPRNDRFHPPVGAVISEGPTTRGFDYFNGFHHAGSMRFVMENDRVLNDEAEVHMLPRLAEKSVAYIEARAADPTPFFLYVALSSPHTPIVPSSEWQGQSPLGDYGDFVMQTDDVIGQITAAIDESGQGQTTLLIVTSDNGTARQAGIEKLAAKGHRVSGPFRGSKADLWEGGHRVPFFVRWPPVVEPQSVCSQAICHVDLFATVAEILGQPIPGSSCEDSVSFLPLLRGRRYESIRKGIVHHSNRGYFAYRMGKWKLLLSRGSGGWTAPRESEFAEAELDAQLYDLEEDPGETNNLLRQRPEVAHRLLAQLEHDVYSGRSTPGTASSNDVSDETIVLWKNGLPPDNEFSLNAR